MWKPKSKAEREMGPELGEGVLQTVEGLVEEEKKKKAVTSTLLELVLFAAVILSGVGIAYLVTVWKRVPFGFYVWPFVFCTDAFLLTTIGYFATEGTRERIYALFSFLSLACLIVQMVVLF